MKIDLLDDRGLNSSISSATRQNDALVEFDKYSAVLKEVNQMEGISKAIGLVPPAMEVFKRMEELRKLVDIPDYMKKATDQLNLASTLGVTPPIMEEIKRMNELENMFTPPAGIASIMQQKIEQNERMLNLIHYSMPEPLPEPLPVVDFPVIRPFQNPMRETNKNLKETKGIQSKIAEHLEELVTHAKGTSDQNVRMIKLSSASLICGIVGVVLSTLVGVLSYYAGKSSSAPTPPPAYVEKKVVKGAQK